MVLELPGGTTLESLYQINDQSIWFLIWILKKEKFWSDLTREVLEIPFMVIRHYFLHGPIKWINTYKNGIYHGICRGWYENGQLRLKNHCKDGKKDGIYRSWHDNGQLLWEDYWKDGIYRG